MPEAQQGPTYNDENGTVEWLNGEISLEAGLSIALKAHLRLTGRSHEATPSQTEMSAKC